MEVKGRTSKMALIEGVPYLVRDYPFDPYRAEPLTQDEYETLKRGVAYLYATDFDEGLYPFRGVASGERFSDKVGIWFIRKRGTYRLRIRRPGNEKEAKEYDPSLAKDIIAAVLNGEYTADQFMENRLDASDMGSECYMPPVRHGDDPLAKLMKVAIRLKHAPFGPYGRRLEGLAVDRKRGSTESNNAKGNARRTLRTASRMTPDKFQLYADIWQMESAIILKDRPDAMDPMELPDGKMLVIYPDGLPFEISQENLIDATDLVANAIAETLTEETREDGKESGQSGQSGQEQEEESEEDEQ